MTKSEWVRCPVCGNKTRIQIRADTELKNFPLYCPKCKQESLIDAKDLQVTVINGYVTGIKGGDGAEQDIYLFGENSAVAEYTGKVIAVYHRYDDNETKWIVVPCDEKGVIHSDVELPSDDEIYAQIAFQEQFFSGVLIR